MRASVAVAHCLAAVHGALLKSPPPPTIQSGDKTPESATLFIGLSGYRDIRCGYSVFDAFTQAAHPERVTVGIVEQLGAEDKKCLDKYCELMTKSKGSCLFETQIKVFHMDYAESKGPIIARANQETLIADEEFCLQVDAHSEFSKFWDTKLIHQWQDTGNDNGILTTYVHDISLRRGGETSAVPHVCKTQFGGHNMVRNSQATIVGHFSMPHPRLTFLWCAGESFGKCRAEKQVPYDHNLPQIFDGEEFSRAIRLWTHGYDFYTPNTNLVFHDYFKKMGDPKLVEESIWNFHPPPQPNKWKEVAKSVRRLKTLLKMKGGRKENLGPKYGLGSVRSYDQYAEFSGVDPRKRKASTGAKCSLDNLKDWVPFDDSHLASEVFAAHLAPALTAAASTAPNLAVAAAKLKQQITNLEAQVGQREKLPSETPKSNPFTAALIRGQTLAQKRVQSLGSSPAMSAVGIGTTAAVGGTTSNSSHATKQKKEESSDAVLALMGVIIIMMIVYDCFFRASQKKKYSV